MRLKIITDTLKNIHLGRFVIFIWLEKTDLLMIQLETFHQYSSCSLHLCICNVRLINTCFDYFSFMHLILWFPPLQIILLDLFLHSIFQWNYVIEYFVPHWVGWGHYGHFLCAKRPGPSFKVEFNILHTSMPVYDSNSAPLVL